MPPGFSVPASTPLGVQSTQVPGGHPQHGSQLTTVGTNSLIHLWLLFLPCPLLLKPSLHPHFMGSLPSYVPVSLFRVCSMRAVCLVTQPSLTPCDPLDCSPPGSPVHGILQATMLEGVALPFSRGSSQPRDQTCVSCISGIAGRFFTSEPPGNLWSIP